MLLHGEQYLELKAPLPAAGRLKTVPRIIDIKVQSLLLQTLVPRDRAIPGCVWGPTGACICVCVAMESWELQMCRVVCLVVRGGGRESAIRGLAAAIAETSLPLLLRMHV